MKTSSFSLILPFLIIQNVKNLEIADPFPLHQPTFDTTFLTRIEPLLLRNRINPTPACRGLEVLSVTLKTVLPAVTVP
jgi:hypothetical protein